MCFGQCSPTLLKGPMSSLPPAPPGKTTRNERHASSRTSDGSARTSMWYVVHMGVRYNTLLIRATRSIFPPTRTLRSTTTTRKLAHFLTFSVATDFSCFRSMFTCWTSLVPQEEVERPLEDLYDVCPPQPNRSKVVDAHLADETRKLSIKDDLVACGYWYVAIGTGGVMRS